MMELTLKDFQGWESATVKVRGFTVIRGESSRGKSAIARALRAILRNALAEKQIRIGTKEARVALVLDDHEIETSRNRKGSATYVVDGAEFSKLGGAVPPVMENWGFQPVEVNGVKVDPIFAGQFDSQFLLSSSPAETSAILNAFSSTERLDQGRKTLKSEVAEVDAEAKVLGGQVSALEAQVAALEAQSVAAKDLRSGIASQMATARGCHQTLKALQNLYNAVVGLADVSMKLRGLEGVDTRSAAATTALVRLQTLILLRDTVVQRGRISLQLGALDKIPSRLQACIEAQKRLQGLGTLHTCIGKQAVVQQHLDAVERVSAPMELTANRYKVMVRVRALIINDPSPLKARVDGIRDLSDDTARVEAKARIRDIVTRLVDTRSALLKVNGEVSSTQQAINDVEAERLEAEAALEHLKTEHRIVTCPKCHTEFSAPHKEGSHD